MLRAVSLALLLVLAGCQAPGASVSTASSPDGGDARPTTDGNTTTPSESNATDGSTPANASAPDDPPDDRLGWEAGYWHNESLDVTADDGLNESELDAVVARSMARVEVVRQMEFDSRVPVEVTSRSAYRNRSGGNRSAALARFDNAKFEALFLVGEENSSIETQESARGQSVLGFYSPTRDAIVLVSESETPRLDGEGTLAHELVHALQDQQFNLSQGQVRTRDAYQGRNGLIEGDASLTQGRYLERCGDQWDCLGPAGDAGADTGTDAGAGDDAAPEDGTGAERSGPAGHFGIQFMMYFPYSDGPGFVRSLYQDGGWAAVNDAYDEVPDGSTEVIDPSLYDEWEPANVTLRDRSSAEWERVEPPGRVDYARPGQSAIAASLAYTLTDSYNRSSVVAPRDVLNAGPTGALDQDDPFEYDPAAAAGWTGGKMFVYRNGSESGYVWRTRWTDAGQAREFATTWEVVIGHWGGERVGTNEWVIGDGPFADAFAVRQEGKAVTIVNAPERDQLSGVHGADA